MQKQRLKQEIGLNLSPQQIQFMSLLQIPLLSLEKRIEEELESNPALEEAPAQNDKEENNSDPWESNTNYSNNSREEKQTVVARERELSLQEFLLQQLPMHSLKEEEKLLAEFIIGCLDDNGFLSRSLFSITDDILFKLNINVSETQLYPLLKIVQKLDPVGVGARDLKECLLLQLESKPASDTINLAKAILTKQYTAFTNKNYEKLIKEFEVDDNQLKEAYKEVEQLNPKPGASFTNTQEGNSYITPDFILEEENDELSAALSNSKSKKLRSSQYYKKMLHDLEQGKGDKDAILFLKEKIEGAEWFANALIQREQTLLKTMNCILSIQEAFFKTGDNKLLKPMKLMDISEKIDLDISTISRVTNSKYIETPYGTFLLKEFFSDAYSKEDGTVISNKVIKSHLEDILENEDKKKPYSDEELSEKLDEIGFHIARRTVAKYRDQLGVAVARLRREL
ncbi:MAG: RNA polymerase factor sigma-54 [Flavobacteriales bacterium]|nr:RNA polymerase factor sigma-54 [Flavobacteriales bacterium]